MINYELIPRRLMEALLRYVCDGIKPGHFLQAVLQNDLTEAVGRGDDECLAALPSIIGWLYNCAPGPCWGDRERMEQWLAMELDKRQRLTADILPVYHNLKSKIRN